MMQKKSSKRTIKYAVLTLVIFISFFGIGQILFSTTTYTAPGIKNLAAVGASSTASTTIYTRKAEVLGTSTSTPILEVIDKDSFDKKMLYLANRTFTKCATTTQTTVTQKNTATSSTENKTGTSTKSTTTKTVEPKPIVPCVVKPISTLWPAKSVYPNPGALLPFNRIVAYYGNFYSKKMGVLGEYKPAIVLQKLEAEVAKWKAADPETPVIPAIDYIAVTAQGSAGADGKYRARMPDSQIDKAVEMANKINGIVILEIQPGQSTVEAEVPMLKKYLSMPNVHLALDPEFSMKAGQKPGSVIGSMDAAQINFAAQYLAKLVQDNKLPPKILMVHRFTNRMVTNSHAIVPLPDVQVIIDMDGWGAPSHKKKAYTDIIQPYPVQFTGFKLFYKNDVRKGTTMMTPAEVLKLSPIPSFIQYQ